MAARYMPLLALILVAACGSQAPTAPTSEWIDLNSLTPASGTTLTAGERVTFTATVTCTIVSSDGGRTVLLLTDQGSRTLNVAGQGPPVAELPKGTATVTLTDTITVPPSGSTVTLSVPLFINGSNSTRAVKTATYPVR